MSLVKIAAVTSIIVAPALAVSQLVDPFQSAAGADTDVGITTFAMILGPLCALALVVMAFGTRWGQDEPEPVRIRANKPTRQRAVRRL